MDRTTLDLVEESRISNSILQNEMQKFRRDIEDFTSSEYDVTLKLLVGQDSSNTSGAIDGSTRFLRSYIEGLNNNNIKAYDIFENFLLKNINQTVELNLLNQRYSNMYRVRRTDSIYNEFITLVKNRLSDNEPMLADLLTKSVDHIHCEIEKIGELIKNCSKEVTPYNCIGGIVDKLSKRLTILERTGRDLTSITIVKKL